MRKVMLLLAVLSMAAVGLAACGGDDDSSDSGSAATDTPATTTEESTGGGGASGSQVQLSADPNGSLAYDTDSLSGAGTNVQIAFTNESGTPHDVRVEGADGTDVGGTDIFTGSSETADLELESGEYTFFCSVPGHRQAGMEGTLTVE